LFSNKYADIFKLRKKKKKTQSGKEKRDSESPKATIKAEVLRIQGKKSNERKQLL